MGGSASVSRVLGLLLCQEETHRGGELPLAFFHSDSEKVNEITVTEILESRGLHGTKSSHLNYSHKTGSARDSWEFLAK